EAAAANDLEIRALEDIQEIAAIAGNIDDPAVLEGLINQITNEPDAGNDEPTKDEPTKENGNGKTDETNAND
ncbi:MAG: hypothetical protein ABIR47_15520, partial [Candidatus Kapaibacterium sp.]